MDNKKPKYSSLAEWKKAERIAYKSAKYHNFIVEICLMFGWEIPDDYNKLKNKIKKIEAAIQSKETIIKIAKINLSKAGKNEKIIKAIDTQREIAKLAGVGRTTIVRYNRVISKASESIINKMKNGKISINSAYNSIQNS